MNPRPEPAPIIRTALEAIASRRTARQFDPNRQVPDRLLADLIRQATLAPSPANLQPWRFVVVRDRRNREKLRGCTFGEARITDAPVVLIVLGYRNPHRTELAAVVALGTERGAIAPEAAARLLAETPRAWERSPDRAFQATGPALVAVGLLLIAAEAVGVASALLDSFDREQVRQAFGIPDDHEIACLVALGFATASPPFPGRFDLDHVCFAEHFGQPWPPGEAGG